MRFPAILLSLLLLAAPASAEDFTIGFGWGDIPLCTSGRPGMVPSPKFTVKGLPAGTDRIQFRLRDLNAPRYNHGGGTIRVTRDGTIPAGVFTYKSPCPPGGTHVYEWRATAKRGGKVLGVATARRSYPQ